MMRFPFVVERRRYRVASISQPGQNPEPVQLSFVVLS
jgi:hypothetical protein